MRQEAREAARRIMETDREKLIQYLLQSRVMRLTPEGAGEDLRRDIDAGRRVAMDIINILKGAADERRSAE